MSRVRANAPLPRLGALEQAVLEHLWQHADADVQETHAAVGIERGITPNTINSTLERLCRKGFLTREKVSHAFRYRAVIDRDTFRARRVLDAAGGMRALRSQSVLAAFVDILADGDTETLDRLERLIATRRGGKESR